MTLITYEDKEFLNENAQIPEKNKVTADNMNAIKNAINNPYQIGDVIVNSSADYNPNNEFVGQTWELIDKEFTPFGSSQIKFDGFTPNTEYISNSNEDDWSFFLARSGHSLNLEIVFKAIKDITDAVAVLGTFNYANLGITRFTNSLRFTGYSDGTNNIVMFYIPAVDGELQTVDIVGADSLPSGNSTVFTLTTSINYTQMLDSACNKFFWKRTA